MSGIAELLANRWYEISGSDLKQSEVTRRLAGFGVQVHEGHSASNVGSADVVVISSAVRPDNPEGTGSAPAWCAGHPAGGNARGADAHAVLDCRRRLPWQDDDDVDDRVRTGTRGLDPDAVIGGRLKAFGSNARLGRGEYLVAEADESDRSFLMLWPSIAVVTNIDHEHMESYASFAELQQAFVESPTRCRSTEVWSRARMMRRLPTCFHRSSGA
jgi:UDP-N-acetylmuramate--alanine ligase